MAGTQALSGVARIASCTGSVRSKPSVKRISSSRRASTKSWLAPALSERAKIGIACALSDSWRRASASASMWSLAVLAAALPGRSSPAIASPLWSR